MEAKIHPKHQAIQPGIEAKLDPQPKVIRYIHKSDNKLKDKVALITSGDSGIGRAVVEQCKRSG